MSALIVCCKDMKFYWQTRIIPYFSIRFFLTAEKARIIQGHEPATGISLSASNTGVLLTVCENTKKAWTFRCRSTFEALAFALYRRTNNEQSPRRYDIPSDATQKRRDMSWHALKVLPWHYSSKLGRRITTSPGHLSLPCLDGTWNLRDFEGQEQALINALIYVDLLFPTHTPLLLRSEELTLDFCSA